VGGTLTLADHATVTLSADEESFCSIGANNGSITDVTIGQDCGLVFETTGLGYYSDQTPFPSLYSVLSGGVRFYYPQTDVSDVDKYQALLFGRTLREFRVKKGLVELDNTYVTPAGSSEDNYLITLLYIAQKTQIDA